MWIKNENGLEIVDASFVPNACLPPISLHPSSHSQRPRKSPQQGFSAKYPLLSYKNDFAFNFVLPSQAINPSTKHAGNMRPSCLYWNATLGSNYFQNFTYSYTSLLVNKRSFCNCKRSNLKDSMDEKLGKIVSSYPSFLSASVENH
jgi:hypothetical protein